MEALQPADLAAALGWWREAGVDLDFSDTPTRWLAEPQAKDPAAQVAPKPPVPSSTGAERPASAPMAPVAVLGGPAATWPTDLEAFRDWWLNEPALDEGRSDGRVPPRGAAGAQLMVVVPQPEAGDTDRLLSGPEGQLLDAMLGAMGLGPDAVYVAAVLPRHSPVPDWRALAANGAGALLAHHVGLVAPQRLILFGGNILPLLGHDPTQSAQILPPFNHEDRSVPLLGARELGAMLARPAWKAGFWRNWLDWTGTASA